MTTTGTKAETLERIIRDHNDQWMEQLADQLFIERYDGKLAPTTFSQYAGWVDFDDCQDAFSDDEPDNIKRLYRFNRGALEPVTVTGPDWDNGGVILFAVNGEVIHTSYGTDH